MVRRRVVCTGKQPNNRINSDCQLRCASLAAGYAARQPSYSVLTGLVGLNDPLRSTYDFTREIVGYDLAGFFDRNRQTLRDEIDKVLQSLLTPEAR